MFVRLSLVHCSLKVNSSGMVLTTNVTHWFVGHFIHEREHCQLLGVLLALSPVTLTAVTETPVAQLLKMKDVTGVFSTSVLQM